MDSRLRGNDREQHRVIPAKAGIHKRVIYVPVEYILSMLKQKFIPSPLIRPEEREPIVIDEKPSGVRFRGWFLIRQLLKLGSRLLKLKLARTLEQAAFGVVLRDFFQEMGVLWIKVGQLLSLRIDLLSPTICDELSKLQDQAYGFSPAIARRMLEEGLGSPVAEVFDPFIETPFAAASIMEGNFLISHNPLYKEDTYGLTAK